MSLRRLLPVRDLAAFPSDLMGMQREINRMFNNFFQDEEGDNALARTAWIPPVDLAEREKDYVLRVELPGVQKGDVHVTMADNTLTIRGEKKQESAAKGSAYHRIERSYGTFQRSFTLPSDVRGEQIDATFADGVLTIVLPKAENARRREIDVKVV